MPNYVLNVLELIGEHPIINDLLEKIKYDDKPIGTLDFNKIIPMPTSLDIESGSEESLSIMAYLKAASPNVPADFGVEKLDEIAFIKILEQLNRHRFQSYSFDEIMDMKLDESDNARITKGKIYIDNLLKYNTTTWYDWCRDNWGTKWNSFNPMPLKNNTLIFDTAWSNAIPVIKKLSEMYPDIHFKYAWSDEDIGTNVGKCEIVNNHIICQNIPVNCSKEAFEMAAEIREESLEDLDLYYSEEKGTYIYRENE